MKRKMDMKLCFSFVNTCANIFAHVRKHTLIKRKMGRINPALAPTPGPQDNQPLAASLGPRGKSAKKNKTKQDKKNTHIDIEHEHTFTGSHPFLLATIFRHCYMVSSWNERIAKIAHAETIPRRAIPLLCFSYWCVSSNGCGRDASKETNTWFKK